MTAAYPSSTNVFVPDHAASGKLVVDFARSIKDFAVNEYAQIIPVKKVIGLYLKMTIEEAGRIQQSDLANFVWPDSGDAPKGDDGAESFEFETYRTQRFAYPVRLGDLTIDQASWNITAQHASIKARQAMTARTQLVITAATTSANYDATHYLDVTGITGNSGAWSESTSSRQDIKRSLNVAAELILQDTLNGVKLDDLIVVINPTLAREMAECQELTDYLKHSPAALAQVRGELPGKNVMFGLPDKLYGYPIVVEATYKVTTKKGATTSRSAVLPTATPFMCARPGGLVGVADSPNFSTHCLFAAEEMTVETLKDVNNRYQVIRVVENIAAETVAPVSGVLFYNAG
ncbi:MAG: hypothetical protein PHU85_15570 [Phycisphaerae bacterium]|nr:hypothetical protein [Phycisphaerae bacterium]